MIGLAVLGCATHREDLNRGQVLFEDDRYEASLAVWRALEADQDEFEVTDRARYFYLRGMTDYRLGYRTEARHWLALARALEAGSPGSLQKDWLSRMNSALAELNAEVWGTAAPKTPMQEAAIVN